VTCTEIRPAEYGLECDDLADLAGGDPRENAQRITELLAGKGREVERCAVLLNAAAALYVSGRGWTFEQALTRARDTLDAGAAAETLARLKSAD
jgi:anthranilate phosphoribosyltransferase